MDSLKRKVLSCLLAVMLILSVMPLTVFAAEETATVSTQEDLFAAIEAIPEGGSGEITIANIEMVLSEGIYIYEKDVTFNLVNAQLVTTMQEDGCGQPVILGFGANITLNLDDNSFMESQGHTGCMGVVRVDNSTDWNEETQSFEKDFTLIVNGGSYTCTDIVSEDDVEDYVFVAASGTKAILTNVVCNGKVEAIAYENVGINIPGELIINSGKFTNDVSEYAADGKYFCEYGENYYIREKEMSDDFSKPLTNGKLIFNYVKPSADDDSLWLIAEDFNMANPDFYFDPEGFNDDFSKLELGIYFGTAKEEFHVVDVTWNYDESVLQAAQAFIEKFPEDDRPWFNVSDLELVNYWAYHNPESEIDSLANYSGELKSILGNTNFLYTIEVRGGADDVFYTERIGSAKLIHNGNVYFSSTMIGARAEHAIYVPESTESTKNALIAAAQKRINDYIGEDIVEITASNETVTDYYNSEIALFDDELATAQIELARAQATLATEQEKDQSLWDWNIINQCQIEIMAYEYIIEYVPIYKQYFIDQFNEGGDLHFLTKAEGDYFFNVEVVDREESYKFVIIKDDTKLIVPSCETVDLNTQISVATDSSTVPLDTLVQVDKITEGTDYDKIIDILDIEENETFDIKLHSNSLDKYVTKLESGKFEVKIPIPEKFEGKNLIVYYVDQNDNPVEYEVSVKDGFAIFKTDHFSIYTLAAKATETTNHTQHTGGSATCCSKAICSECNQPYGEFNASNHSQGIEIRNAKSATKTEKGYTGDTYCKGCGEKIADGKEIPATGSVYPPKTADASQFLLWAMLAFISGSVLVGTFILNKKKTAQN